ncbi:hypothetical protein [Eikenella corrodens]|jgi:hypothetical protein|nr:hypothetical protein [Eikenella corrodens]MDU1346618.1 hypothetical protein [Eikenella corrodens]
MLEVGLNSVEMNICALKRGLPLAGKMLIFGDSGGNVQFLYLSVWKRQSLLSGSFGRI